MILTYPTPIKALIQECHRALQTPKVPRNDPPCPLGLLQDEG